MPVHRAAMTLGERVGSDYIVSDGVKAGERIVVEGIQKARPGTTVNPSESAVTTESARANKGE